MSVDKRPIPIAENRIERSDSCISLRVVLIYVIYPKNQFVLWCATFKPLLAF